MTGLVRFIQNSVGKIHDSVKTYTTNTLYIHCQGCNNHVPVRVLDVLAKPEKSTEIKCEGCSRVVCFTAGRPGHGKGRSLSSGQINYGEPVSLGMCTIKPLAKNDSDYDFGASAADLVSNIHIPAWHSNQNISTEKSSTLTNIYGGQADSISNDSLHDDSEDRDSFCGRSGSHRSSISLARRPSITQSKLNMLGLEQCCEKAGPSRTLWNPVFGTYRTGSPTPSSTPFSSSYPSLRSFLNEGALRSDDPAIVVELERSEDGHTIELSVSRRNSADSKSSLDLSPGKLELIRRNSDTDPPRLFDSDLTSIRGGISDKRRGKLPIRVNTSIHRLAISQRHSIKIEKEEKQEAKTISAKRRNSMTTDFDVEPTDEEVRQAHKIYTEASQYPNPHPESDVQWARVILRRRKNWEYTRYEHPLTSASLEQLQLKSRKVFEPSGSGRPLGLHQPLIPLMIPTLAPPDMLPRPSGFSPPTPVEEESEGDAPYPGSAMSLFDRRPPGPLAGGSGPLETSNTEPEKLVVQPPPTLRAEDSALTFQSGSVQVSTGLSGVVKPKPENSKARRRDFLTGAARKVFCFYKSRSSRPPTQIEPKIEHLTMPVTVTDVPPPVETEPPTHQQPRFSGEIQEEPTSEEPFIRVGTEISALVGGMTSPSIQIQFQARAEDLFTR